jgi:hypothetical protein
VIEAIEVEEEGMIEDKAEEDLAGEAIEAVVTNLNISIICKIHIKAIFHSSSSSSHNLERIK